MERKLYCICSYLEKTQRKKGVTVNIEYLGGCGLEPSHVVGVGGVRWRGHSGRKIGRQFLKKLHTLLPYGSAILLGCYLRETKACTPTKTGAQAPTNWWMNRQAVACPSFGGFSAVKRKYTHYERDEPPAQQAGGKRLQTACCGTAFTWNDQKRKTGQDRKRESGCLGLAVGTGRDSKRHRCSSWGDSRVLKLDHSDGHTTL